MPQNRHKFHLLLHSAELLEDQLRLRLAPLGIGPRQARVIEALHRMGDVSQATLASEFQITPASMSTMTRRLIASGFITRHRDPRDVRGNLLSLTDAGEEILLNIRNAWDEIENLVAAAVGPDGLDNLAQETRTLRDALGGHRPGHHHNKKRSR